jgi:hypothetical protein
MRIMGISTTKSMVCLSVSNFAVYVFTNGRSEDRTIELLETVLEEVSKNASFVLEVVELLSELDW